MDQRPNPSPLSWSISPEDKRAGWLSSLLVPPPVQGQLPVCRDRHCCSGKGSWSSRWLSQVVTVTDIHLAKQLFGNTMRPMIKGATGRHCPQPGQARHSLSLPGCWNFPDSGHQEPSGTGRAGQGAWEGAQGVAEGLEAESPRLQSDRRGQWLPSGLYLHSVYPWTQLLCDLRYSTPPLAPRPPIGSHSYEGLNLPDTQTGNPVCNNEVRVELDGGQTLPRAIFIRCLPRSEMRSLLASLLLQLGERDGRSFPNSAAAK